MIRYAIPAFAFAAALPMTAQAAEIQIAATGPVVELNVLEEVDAAPDMVTVSAGVSSEAPTAVEALRQNSRAMRARKCVRAISCAPGRSKTASCRR